MSARKKSKKKSSVRKKRMSASTIRPTGHASYKRDLERLRTQIRSMISSLS